MCNVQVVSYMQQKEGGCNDYAAVRVLLQGRRVVPLCAHYWKEFAKNHKTAAPHLFGTWKP